jgi:hypothetical protein
MFQRDCLSDLQENERQPILSFTNVAPPHFSSTFNEILQSNEFVLHLPGKMNGKNFDLSAAVHYHTGRFPPSSLDYGHLMEPQRDPAGAAAEPGSGHFIAHGGHHQHDG